MVRPGSTCQLSQLNNLVIRPINLIMMKIGTEILINAFLVSAKDFFINKSIHKDNTQFEFILNHKLELLDCIKLQTATANKNFRITELPNYKEIYNALFEINHIRINPEYNNMQIIKTFTKALTDIGVKIYNPPSQDSLAICYQPLGAIKDKVRFYIKEDHNIVFLAKTARPKLVYSA